MQFDRSEWQIFDNAGRRKYQSASERSSFLAAADRLPDSHRALCYVLTFTGCRISEALSLTRDQLDDKLYTLSMRTLKRRRIVFRSVPIPEPLCHLLRKLPRRSDGRLWHIHRTTAWRIVRDTANAAHIVGSMACPRGCRHGFGIHAASSNVPPNLIQRWMGHASLSTTSIYIDAVGAEERGFAARMWTDRSCSTEKWD